MNTSLARLNRLTPKLQGRVIEVGRRLEGALAGDWRDQQWIKNEAFTTSDFPQVFSILNNFVIQAAFTKVQPGFWTKVSKKVVLDNLKPYQFKSFDMDSSNLPASEAGVTRQPGSLPHIPELGQYPAIGFTSAGSSIATSKVGARIAFSWEAFREDDYNVISQLPTGLVTMARRTEDTQTYGVLLDSSGWNQANFPTGSSATYLAANAALATGNNAPLTRDSLSAALAQAKKVPAPINGELRLNTIQKWALIVPSSLVPQAETILAAGNIVQFPGSVTGQSYTVPNLLTGKFEIVELPYIQTMAASSGYKDTMWGIVPFGGEGSDRPTIVTTFLRGVEVPELRIKDDTGDTLSGGELDPFAGSFDNDAIEVRIRYFVDAWLTDRLGMVLSKGNSGAL